jgi:hypothetical protein
VVFTSLIVSADYCAHTDRLGDARISHKPGGAGEHSVFSPSLPAEEVESGVVQTPSQRYSRKGNLAKIGIKQK